MGAELVLFSPIHDKRLPENLDGLLLYGGYPELNGKMLEQNQCIKAEIRDAVNGGMPVWQSAEALCTFMRKWRIWKDDSAKWQV